MRYLFSFFILFFSFSLSFSQTQWWAEQNSGVTATLTSVYVPIFASGVVWVCGYNGTVLRTTNSGTTWLNVTGNGIPTNVLLVNIIALDANTALTAGYIGTANTWVWKTTNGGANWIQVFNQPNGFIDGMAIRTNPIHDAILIGDPIGGRWTIFKTTNFGATWDSTGLYLEQNGSEAGWNNSVYWSKTGGPIGDSSIWFGTNNYRLYHSTNFGANWIVRSIPSEQNSYAMGFMLYAGLTAGVNLLHTTNYGYSWTLANNTPGAGNFGGVVLFASSVEDNSLNTGHCWYVRSDSNVYRGFASDNFIVDYTAPAGTFRHINTASYGGPIWAVRDNGGISACMTCNVIGVTPISNEIPKQFNLKQSYPNPFNPETIIEFDVPKTGQVKVEVFDNLGRRLEVLADQQVNAGMYMVKWNAAKYSSGVYFYRISAAGYFETKKMILIK